MSSLLGGGFYLAVEVAAFCVDGDIGGEVLQGELAQSLGAEVFPADKLAFGDGLRQERGDAAHGAEVDAAGFLAGAHDFGAALALADGGDDAGLEADAIVELADGRWAAFEFKVGESKVGEGVASLKRLRKKVSENPKARTSPPEFLAVIAGVSEYARKVEDGVYVIPLRALCA